MRHTKIFYVVLIFILSTWHFNILALPKAIEFWFLSEVPEVTPTSKSSSYFRNIQSKNLQAILEIKNIPYVDENDESSITAPITASKAPLSDLIYCDKKNSSLSSFRFFCGTPAHPSPQAKISFEIWIDISSSIKYVDPPTKEGSCGRKDLVEKITSVCNKNRYQVFLFNTQLKKMNSIHELCTMDGLNDYQRMIKWIKDSNASNLLIISDVFELRKEFTDELKKLGVIIKGDSVKSSIKARDLKGKALDAIRYCQ